MYVVDSLGSVRWSTTSTVDDGRPNVEHQIDDERAGVLGEEHLVRERGNGEIA